MVVFEEITAYGHVNIRAMHRTTFEITKEAQVTPRGDCIIGVRADKSARELSKDFKEALKNDDSILIIVLEVNGLKDIVLAQGSSKLILEDDKKIIVRRSSYIEPATLGITANKAARDIDRRVIELLKNPETIIKIKLLVFRLSEINSMYKNIRSII